MAITLLERASLIQEPQFVQLITAALSDIASEVIETDDPATLPGGDEQFNYRINFARSVVRDAQAAAAKKLWIVAGFSPTTTPWTLPDETLLAGVRSKWNTLSGYNVNEPVVV